MAEVKVIEVQIKSNIDGATSSVSKLKAGLKDATTQSKELGSTLEGSKQSEFINTLANGVGKLNPAFGTAIQGANGLLLKMYQLIANPIGLVIAALVVSVKFLYEAFESSIAGGKELKAIFAAVSTVGEQVKDAIFGLGRALINTTTAAYKFITLDFKGAAEDMKAANKEATESYKQLGKAVDGTTAKIEYNLTKQQQANDKARKVQAVTQAKTNLLLVKSREILTDETASIKDKKKALEEVTKAEIASSAEKERIALKDLQIAKVRAKNLGGEAEKKMKGELRDLDVAYMEAQTENAQTGFKLNKQKKMLGRQEAADAKEKNDAIIASNKEVADKIKAQLKIEEDERKRIAKENLDAMMASAKEVSDKERQLRESKETPAQKEEREYQEWLIKYQANNLNTELLDKQHKDNLAIIAKTDAEKKAADDKIISDKIAADKKASDDKEIEFQKNKDAAIAASKANLNNIIAGLEASGLAKTKAGQIISKAIALTQIGIDSAVAISKASTLANAEGVAAQLAFPLVPGIGTIARVISYASTAASVIGNIARARQLLSSGSASGGSAPSGGGGGGSAPAVPAAPAFNVVGASSTNQLAQTIGNQQQQPIKAYVVSNDVTTAQGLDRNIIASATIG